MSRAGCLALGGAAVAAFSEYGPDATWLAALIAVTSAVVGVLTAVRRRPNVAAALLGAGAVALRVALVPAEAPAAAPPDAHRWVATVVEVRTPAEGRQRAVVLATPDGVTSAPGTRLWAALPRYPAVAPGDGISFEGFAEPAPADGAFGAYLRRSRIAGTITVHAMEASPDRGGIERLRRAAGDALAAVLPEPQAGLAAGIVVGLRDRVDRSVASEFATAGLSHVVAISGWNIALVSGCLAALLRGLGRRPRSVAIVMAIGAYTVFAGASPSVVRAALMAAVVMLARESGRRGAAASALGLAAWVMLAVEPATIADAGYQLSVVATAGLLAWGTPFSGSLRRRFPRAPTWLVETLGVSLAAQLATMPIVLLAFGRLSLVAPAVNLVVAPLVAPAMFVGLLALAVGALVGAGLPAALALPVTTLGWAVLGGLIAAGHAAASLPLASLDLSEPWNAVAAAVAAAAILALASPRVRRAVGRALRARRRRGHGDRPSMPTSPGARTPGRGRATRPLAIGLVALVSLVTLVAASRPDGWLRVTVLDVGQGDAILLEGAAGGRILVDSGPDPDRLLALLDGRLPPWDRRIDLVIVTHPHEDHVAGAALLLGRYRVGGVATAGDRGYGPGWRAFEDVLAATDRRRATLTAGDRLALDGARIDVLWPPADHPSPGPNAEGFEINNVSIVLDVRFAGRRLLLTGDVEEEIDPRLLTAGVGSQRVDVLKVAHHGSGTATTDPFLAATRPRVAVVSSGAGNRYGHPNPGTLERLTASGARVLRTDRDGSVTVATDGRSLTVTAAGGRSAATQGVRAVAPASLPTIAAWSCRIVPRPPPFSSASLLPAGS